MFAAVSSASLLRAWLRKNARVHRSHITNSALSAAMMSSDGVVKKLEAVFVECVAPGDGFSNTRRCLCGMSESEHRFRRHRWSSHPDERSRSDAATLVLFRHHWLLQLAVIIVILMAMFARPTCGKFASVYELSKFVARHYITLRTIECRSKLNFKNVYQIRNSNGFTYMFSGFSYPIRIVAMLYNQTGRNRKSKTQDGGLWTSNTCISVCTQDSNENPTGIPMFSVLDNTTGIFDSHCLTQGLL